jgi:hypothetical protein
VPTFDRHENPNTLAAKVALGRSAQAVVEAGLSRVVEISLSPELSLGGSSGDSFRVSAPASYSERCRKGALPWN